MAIQPLDNGSWGFESNCFVCEPKNEGGLRIPFFHDDEQHIVFAEYELSNTFSGAPSYAHGGVTMAILDEAMAWATIAIAKAFALTQSTNVDFAWPVRLARRYRVEARIIEQAEQSITTTGSILDPKGRACVTATSRFRPMNATQAEDAIGTDISTTTDASYLRAE